MKFMNKKKTSGYIKFIGIKHIVGEVDSRKWKQHIDLMYPTVILPNITVNILVLLPLLGRLKYILKPKLRLLCILVKI